MRPWKHKLSKLRQQLETKRDPRARVPPAIKREAVLIIERARQNGMTYRAISKQIGVNSHTLRHWRETSKVKSQKRNQSSSDCGAKFKTEKRSRLGRPTRPWD